MYGNNNDRMNNREWIAILEHRQREDQGRPGDGAATLALRQQVREQSIRDARDHIRRYGY